MKRLKLSKTKIDWADYGWNFMVGCNRACHYCYAKKIAARFAEHWAFKENQYRSIQDGILKGVTNEELQLD